jgi:hypothetical protein
MNQRLMRAAEAQMARAEDLRREAEQALTPEGHAAAIRAFEAAFAAGRLLVIDARDADPDPDEE